MSKAQITAHLKKFEKAQRAILNQLRSDILEELPTAQEIIMKYGISGAQPLEHFVETINAAWNEKD